MVRNTTIASKAQFILPVLIILVSYVQAQSVPVHADSVLNPYVLTYSSANSEVQAASYPGGERAMYGYLTQSVRYPRKAVRNHTMGKVVVTAIVEKDGSLSNVKIIQDIGDGCGESVLRAVKRMQRWHCATKDRIPVCYEVRIPVTFRL